MAGRAATAPCCASQTKWRTGAWETVNGGFVPLTLVTGMFPFQLFVQRQNDLGSHVTPGLAWPARSSLLSRKGPIGEAQNYSNYTPMASRTEFSSIRTEYMAGNSQYCLSLIRRSQRRNSSSYHRGCTYVGPCRSNPRRRLAQSASLCVIRPDMRSDNLVRAPLLTIANYVLAYSPPAFRSVLWWRPK